MGSDRATFLMDKKSITKREVKVRSRILEKWFPLWGERAHSLKYFCMYIRGLR